MAHSAGQIVLAESEGGGRFCDCTNSNDVVVAACRQTVMRMMNVVALISSEGRHCDRPKCRRYTMKEIIDTVVANSAGEDDVVAH